ncbi:MAG: hypothetical protein LBQ48_01815 [Oscillospiraceae bacterium]|jgi:hypothetical protein|nr:hypothetical protein [Oscillospiraceae bacterium]
MENINSQSPAVGALNKSEEFKQKVKALIKSREQLKEQNAALVSELGGLKAQVGALGARLQSGGQANPALESQLENERAQNRFLREQLASAGTGAASAAELQNQLNAERAKVFALEKQLTESLSGTAASSDLNAQIQLERARNSELESQVTQLKSALEESGIRAQSSAQAEHEELRRKIEQITLGQKQAIAAGEAVAAQRAENARLSERIAQLTEQNAELKAELEKTALRCQTLIRERAISGTSCMDEDELSRMLGKMLLDMRASTQNLAIEAELEAASVRDETRRQGELMAENINNLQAELEDMRGGMLEMLNSFSERLCGAKETLDAAKLS